MAGKTQPVICNETDQIFESIKLAAWWLKNKFELKTNIASIAQNISANINNYIRIQDKGYGIYQCRTKSVHGYSFRKVTNEEI